MVRNIIGLVVGFTVGFVLVAIIEAAGHQWAPLPDDLDISDSEAMNEYVRTAPVSVMFALLIAWFVGAVGAVAATGLIARAKITCGISIGCLFFAFAVLNLVMIPHPKWVMLATPFVYATATALGMAIATALPQSKPRRNDENVVDNSDVPE